MSSLASVALGGLSTRESAYEEGQTFVEYAMILALVALVVVVALGVLEGSIGGFFSKVGSSL